jgi:predicted AAA+ superfamily ATPase
MPGIFAVRDEGTRLELIADLIQTTVERDLPLIAGRALVDPAAAQRVLRLIATLDETSDSAIASAARMNTRVVQKYLHLFKMLYFIVEVQPCAGSTGRSQFFLGDVAIAAALGASFRTCLRTWVLLEILAHIEQTGSRLLSEVSTYRGPKGGRMDFIVTRGAKRTAILVLDEERVLQQNVEIARSFTERNPDIGEALALAPVTQIVTINGVRVLPLEFLA